MQLTKLSLTRPIFILMLMVGSVLLGIFAWNNMRKELDPEVQYGVISITTLYPGAGPDEINNLITREIEEAVAAVPGIEDILSSSQEGVSGVAVQFEIGLDMNNALNEVRAKVDTVLGELPEGAERPIIDKLDKVGIEGVALELGEKFGPAVAAAATKWLSSIDTRQIPEALAPLFAAEFSAQLRYDPTLVRGMGYYTGSIFEIEHPESSSSIGGGGRYDGMVGRWLGDDVPAVGISLGIERIVDLVHSAGAMRPGLVLLIDGPEDAARAIRIQQELIQQYRVRLELKPKNLKAVLAELADSFDFFASLGQVENATQLEIKPLG
jgi:hypothetical protein